MRWEVESARQLPKDFPPYSTVQGYFYAWSRNRTFASLNHARRGISRLIDSYTEGVIDKGEFEPRIAGLKQRVSQLQERHQAALDAAETERDLALVISRLEDFSAKVTTGLDNLDRLGMQDIIRTVVRRIEIDDSRIEVIFRVPSPDGPSGPKSPTKTIGSWQHCTGVGRTNLRLARPMPAARKGLRSQHPERRCLDPHRPHPPPHKEAGAGMKSCQPL